MDPQEFKNRVSEDICRRQDQKSKAIEEAAELHKALSSILPTTSKNGHTIDCRRKGTKVIVYQDFTNIGERELFAVDVGVSAGEVKFVIRRTGRTAGVPAEATKALKGWTRLRKNNAYNKLVRFFGALL